MNRLVIFLFILSFLVSVTTAFAIPPKHIKYNCKDVGKQKVKPYHQRKSLFNIHSSKPVKSKQNTHIGYVARPSFI